MPATTKRRIALPANHEVHGPAAPHVKVVHQLPGQVTTWDKVKGYYKGIIAALTATLVIANELSPALNFLPGLDKHYWTAAVAIVGTALTFLKDNEHYVDDL